MRIVIASLVLALALAGAGGARGGPAAFDLTFVSAGGPPYPGHSLPTAQFTVIRTKQASRTNLYQRVQLVIECGGQVRVGEAAWVSSGYQVALSGDYDPSVSASCLAWVYNTGGQNSSYLDPDSDVVAFSG